MKEDNEKDEMITGINVTPLVDITLVLLIIFMATATMMLVPSIEIKLPKAKTAEATKSAPLSVVIDKNDNLYLNGTPISEKGLRNYLKKLEGKGKIPEVIIAADKDVRHGYFIHILDLIRQEGVTKFAINVEPVR